MALAARHAVPVIYPWRDFVAAGDLISYGPIEEIEGEGKEAREEYLPLVYR
jgi:hypothetical protein